MFENQQNIVKSLLQENKNFSHVHNKYSKLKDKISLANEGKESIDQLILEQLKKEKLSLKDQMAYMIYEYQQSH